MAALPAPSHPVRVNLNAAPAGRLAGSAWLRGDWNAAWVSPPRSPAPPCVTAYRLIFHVPGARTVRVHVSADERYSLYLDGHRIGRGSQRGSPWRWHFETYDLPLKPGRHTLVARVWSLGDAAPMAQMRVHGGFLLWAEGPDEARLTTGIAAWTARELPGYRFEGGPLTWGSGHDEIMDGRRALSGWERGRGGGWRPAVKGPPGASFSSNTDRIGLLHRLSPATLPPMLEKPMHAGRVRHLDDTAITATRTTPVRAAAHRTSELGAWQRWWRGGSMRIPPHTTRRAIVDLGDYFCMYPHLTVRGGRGAVVRMHWAESLYERSPDPQLPPDHLWNRPKGNRDEIENKYFVGHGPTWLAPGDNTTRRFDTLWWQAGRYVEVHVQTGPEPLVLSGLELEETRYPLELRSRCATDHARLDAMQSVLVRGLQMCAHETYMDCPYWEQLMYAGDTRLQALCGYVMMQDDRLQRQALQLFADSLLPSGLTQSRFPSAGGQIIPPFSLMWIGMLHDFAQWRGDRSLVASLLPVARIILDSHLQHRRADGLVGAMPGWNFMDWVTGWPSGEPPGTADGLSSALMGQLHCALRHAAELETHAGRTDIAARWRHEMRSLAQAMRRTFWNESRGLMADDVAHTSFSEHAQCMALLCGCLPPRAARRALSALAGGSLPMAATIYFSHYVLEVLAAGGKAEAFFRRLDQWMTLPEQGFRTPYEAPGNTRSDCHAWSSHPLYHLFASISGIQPAEFEFRSVEIRPMMGPLGRIEARLVHPRGAIRLSARARGARAAFTVVLPKNVRGRFIWKGRPHRLVGGREEFVL